jgi:hypothetical protein
VLKAQPHCIAIVVRANLHMLRHTTDVASEVTTRAAV